MKKGKRGGEWLHRFGWDQDDIPALPVGTRADLGDRRRGVNRVEAGERVLAVDVHGAAPTDALAAGPAEGEGRVLLVLHQTEEEREKGGAREVGKRSPESTLTSITKFVPGTGSAIP